MPWQGWGALQTGLLVGEAAWLHPDGRRPSFAGHVTSLVVRYAT